MNVPKNLLEIKEFKGVGYKPIVDYETWRVAILNFIDELLPENIEYLSRHNETDEVFILLKGHCILFLGEGDEKTITKLYATDMVLYRIYNVKRGAWHNHTLSRDAMVLIVENQDTTESNSPVIKLTEEHRNHILKITMSVWNKKISKKI
jgi:hypothetical protein